jgi:hypothetical protein
VLQKSLSSISTSSDLLESVMGVQNLHDRMQCVASNDLGENLWHYGLRLWVEAQQVPLRQKFWQKPGFKPI